MMKIFLSSLISFFSMVMYFVNHPLPMGLLILNQTLFICLLSGMLIKTFWFSYILLLTFLGGLLVLFIYVASIASNELISFNLKFKLLVLFLFFIAFWIMFTYIYNLLWINLIIDFSEMNNFQDITTLIFNENKINLNKLYNNQTFLMTLLLIIYLFIALIAMVTITNIFYGPLRSNF
nr:NADH dehydrogenase subunit 6 [Gonimbrasia belina]